MNIMFREKEDIMSKVIIAVDLGHFKAYRVTKEPFDKSAKAELIESYDSVGAHVKLSDKLSDAAGRFRLSGGRNGKGAGYGEAHNLETEEERRLVKQIAADINGVISREKCETWSLAAGKNINGLIIEHLAPEVKAKLDKNLSCNLTKAGKSELLDCFSKEAVAC
jgi:hypothetical protein